ncbi:hypothetical protein BZG36_02253 [Bifiguratus adelaidae]|uniref:AD domain-containing protein n=1 Tax=Bifiguratus adelaidae TaxID=1938954 RepID=A0A261Y1N3_9FUNG|nr:hypothetical protein BZG36_02253 [Bifiguratus adelaidae]
MPPWKYDYSATFIRRYIGYPTNVTTTTGDTYTGYLYSVEPTGTVILYRPQQDSAGEGTGQRENLAPATFLVTLQHAVAQFEVNTEGVPMERETLDGALVVKADDYTMESAIVQARKEKLMNAFRIQRVPCSPSQFDPEIILVSGSTEIHPPYLTSNIKCQNDSIRSKVASIMNSVQWD